MFNSARIYAASFALIAGALAAPPSRAIEPASVTIDNFAFSPEELKVKAGSKIVFVNHDDIPHSVVGETIKFRSQALDTNETFALSFDKPGEIIYFCGLHPKMKGKIVVTP
jgi:plastocyanin